ncbi:MAG: hypothetical protein COA78_28005 [Blastopirellula sp.]|nr:MAG: hypothetical protein COA78_28005 [Blastopirellula sp.]
MYQRNLKLGLTSLFVLALVVQSSLAVPPWLKLMPFQKIEADANKKYQLTEENGPWMILATSFSGVGADQDAHDLVIELRKDYGLEAYTFKQSYDFSESVEGKGFDQFSNLNQVSAKKMRHRNNYKSDSIAVMVGNYESFEDSEAQSALKKLKIAKPKCLNGGGLSTEGNQIKALRDYMRKMIKTEEKKQKGPMGHAFVSRNPLLPEGYFKPKGPSKLVISINKDSKNSLLTCPGKYSVRVATFRGAVEVDPKKIMEVEAMNSVSGSRLAKAAEKAETLTQALRKQGVEAYVFHDRFESTVSVGSFNNVGTPRSDGKTEINPQILRIMNAYKAGSVVGNRQGYAPKSISGIPFDVQPIPVEVPQVSIATDYSFGF